MFKRGGQQGLRKSQSGRGVQQRQLRQQITHHASTPVTAQLYLFYNLLAMKRCQVVARDGIHITGQCQAIADPRRSVHRPVPDTELPGPV